MSDEQVRELRRLLDVERQHEALRAHFADVHRALGEHDDHALTAAGSVRKLVADNERLRGLVKEAEDMGSDASIADFACPWCGQGRFGKPRHLADCPAFTPEGDVR